MNTKSAMRTMAGAVIGARHAFVGRNGQDACHASVAGDIGVIAVADGCGSAAASEVGAQLGVATFAHALRTRLARGESVRARATWEDARARTAAAIADALEGFGAPLAALHDYFLFTLVVAAATPEGAAVWAIGDGAYAIDDAQAELGPFADNRPPYVAYDLTGDRAEAHFAVAPPHARALAVATDGAVEAGLALADFVAVARAVANPLAIQRRLTLLARASERIDYDARRVMRTPARVQDDCAVAVLAW